MPIVFVVLTILLKAGLERLGIPALIGYLLLGFLMKLADVQGLLLSVNLWSFGRTGHYFLTVSGRIGE